MFFYYQQFHVKGHLFPLAKFKCEFQSNSSGKESNNVQNMGKKETPQACVDACVEEKKNDDKKHTNFVSYEKSTKTCRCSVKELGMKKKDGTQACFLVPNLPGIDGKYLFDRSIIR